MQHLLKKDTSAANETNPFQERSSRYCQFSVNMPQKRRWMEAKPTILFTIPMTESYFLPETTGKFSFLKREDTVRAVGDEDWQHAWKKGGA